LLFVLCGFAGMYFWKPYKSNRLSADATSVNAKWPRLKDFRITRILVSVLFLMAGVLLILLFMRQDEKIKQLARLQRVQLARQTELIETTRNSGLVQWMSLVLQRAETELNQHPERKLREETIATIAALSYSFKPYQRFVEDSVLLKELSPERGMLLLALTRMNMDTNSMQGILLQAHFAHADLKDADLSAAWLKGADLQEANFHGANLENAMLQHANLSSANLWGAKLRNAKMNEAILKLADMSWADINGAVLYKAQLNGAKLASAQLRKADLREAGLQWIDAGEALLQEANLSGADLYGADLHRAHLYSSDLSNANLTMAYLTETNVDSADFTGVNMTRTVVSVPDWMDDLHHRLRKGAAEIQTTYHLVDESTPDKIEYCLEKKKG
jgi:uncharacterized protein YjbI with pentapeptide repeats